MKVTFPGSQRSNNLLIRRWRYWLMSALMASTLIIMSVAWRHRMGHLSASMVLTDARAIGDLPISAGFLSDVGILIWWSAACVCLFTALAISLSRTVGRSSGTGARQEEGGQLCASDEGVVRYLVASGSVTGVLALDDAFMLHEGLLPGLFGIDEKLVYAFYVSSILIWLFAFRVRLLSFLPGWLVLALGCFAASVGFDLLPASWRFSGGLHSVLEDGLKWIGIVLWSRRLWCESLQSLVAAPAWKRLPDSR